MSVTLMLKQYISENGIKQNFVAEKAGISAELLRRSLDGKRRMQADEFVAVCRVLSLDFDFFRIPSTVQNQPLDSSSERG